ncbi:hypothetical protein O6H91_01G151300 [Diphasiastrum complanatum]|uniref:Uncharacterized protein n=2 Tax=Diphasiastrum complanatum TaxID=34168 RepID=A0ACC2EXG1_DIPCM|nr:hypothetical protein O6H91_10G065100 [Diphasiastrum complanatum]KAJ7571144.1 hypothetical protein O6H91_01G151300 [Diphasiastrum complanatum]
MDLCIPNTCYQRPAIPTSVCALRLPLFPALRLPCSQRPSITCLQFLPLSADLLGDYLVTCGSTLTLPTARSTLLLTSLPCSLISGLLHSPMYAFHDPACGHPLL